MFGRKKVDISMVLTCGESNIVEFYRRTSDQYECTTPHDTRSHQYTRTPVHENTSTPVHQNTRTPEHQNTRTPEHQYRELKNKGKRPLNPRLRLD